MSKRSEEAAQKAYPTKYREIPIGYSVPINKYVTERACFVQGYDQAEKDLALTWENIRLICEIDEDMRCHSDWPLRGQEVYYEEVLRRFREMKDK